MSKLTQYPQYSIFKDAAFDLKTGAVIDSIGQVLYVLKKQSKIFLENNTKKENENLNTSNNNKLSLDVGEITKLDSFYTQLVKKSKYTGGFSEKEKGIAIDDPSINVYKIQIDAFQNTQTQTGTDLRSTIEVRVKDPLTAYGTDALPQQPFFSLAISKVEVNTIIQEIATAVGANFRNDKLKYFDFDQVTTIDNPGSRKCFKTSLVVKGSKQALTGGKAEPYELATTVKVYSIDGQNWFSEAYADKAFDKDGNFANPIISGKIWNNLTIPDTVVTINSITVPNNNNPFESYWTNNSNTGVKDKLTSIHSEANTETPNKGYRLLNQEIRDAIYQGNIEQLTFEMAFRLPFYMERPKDTPYTKKNNIENNTYFKKFDAWLGYANTIRTLTGKIKLNEVGKKITEYGTTYHDYNEVFYELIDFVPQDVHKNNKVPAYMAKNFEYENPFNSYKVHAHLPGPLNENNGSISKGPARNLAHLVNATPPVLTSLQKTQLETGVEQYIAVSDGVYSINGIKQIINGGFLVKDTDDSYYIWTFIIKGSPRDLSELVNANPPVLTSLQKTQLENGIISFVAIPILQFRISKVVNGETKNFDEIVNKGYLMKDPSTPADLNFYLFKYSWNETPGNPNYSGITFGFGYDIHSGKTYQDLIEYAGFSSLGNDGLKHDIVTLAIGKSKVEAMKHFYPFRNNVWNTLETPYDTAIKNTPRIMKNRDYLKGAVDKIAKNFVINGEKSDELLLRIFPSASYFFEDTKPQFLNEIEKIYFLSQSWNTGNGCLNPNLNTKRLNPETKQKEPYSNFAKRAIQSFNTHDIRYLKFAIQNSAIAHRDKINNLLKAKAIYDYFKD